MITDSGRDTANGWWEVPPRGFDYGKTHPYIYRERLSTGRWAVVVTFMGQSRFEGATICETEAEAVEFIDAIFTAARWASKQPMLKATSASPG
jgi:hypothetical protein